MMTTTTMSTDLYRIAIDRQAALRHEAAQAHAYQPDHSRTGESLSPTRGPLASIRRRLAGAASFA